MCRCDMPLMSLGQDDLCKKNEKIELGVGRGKALIASW